MTLVSKPLFLADTLFILGVLGVVVAVERKGVKSGREEKEGQIWVWKPSVLSCHSDPLRHWDLWIHS